MCWVINISHYNGLCIFFVVAACYCTTTIMSKITKAYILDVLSLCWFPSAVLIRDVTKAQLVKWKSVRYITINKQQTKSVTVKFWFVTQCSVTIYFTSNDITLLNLICKKIIKYYHADITKLDIFKARMARIGPKKWSTFTKFIFRTMCFGK